MGIFIRQTKNNNKEQGQKIFQSLIASVMRCNGKDQEYNTEYKGQYG